MTDKVNPVICVVGATATGKSDLAEHIAREIHGEIVNADSMQIYKGMDIGTAKVPLGQRSVPYHCIDMVDPGQAYSAALYQSDARRAFDDINSRGRYPVLVGGTGFYVRAAIDNYDFPEGEQTGNSVRAHWKQYLDEFGASALWHELAKLCPESAKAIHENDSKRVIRALELHSQGISYADQLEALHSISQAVPAVFIGLDVERSVLHERINRRVDAMREAGLEAEVQHLLDCGFRAGITSMQAIGYKEIVAAYDGEMTLDEAYDRIKTSTRRYAKRQCTWFRKDGRINWIQCDNRPSQDIFAEAMDIVRKHAE